METSTAKHGQGLRALVQARHRILEQDLNAIQKGAPGKSADIEAALSALKALLSGNLDQIPPMVAQELSRWIETSKHLGTAKVPPVPPQQGQSLRALVEARQRELKAAPEKSADIDAALTALAALLSGDLDRIPPVVAQDLSRWIETSKYLGRQ
jgi:hypothetical protein